MARPSIRDVAVLARVSVGTVSNVLNRPEVVAAGTYDRVHAAIDELGFVPNEAARQLREGASRAIGLVLPDLTNPFFARLAHGVEDAAAAAGASVLVGNTNLVPARRDEYLRLFEHHGIRGVLIFAGQDIGEQLAQLHRAGVATVAIGPRGANASGPSVTVDDLAGGRMAVEHLIATGRRNILFVGGPLGNAHADDRLWGAQEAAAEHPQVQFRLLETDGLEIGDGEGMVDVVAELVGAERPDAIFAANDFIALGLIPGLRASGIRIPQDIAVIGYDDVPMSASRWTSLSSVRQPAEEVGRYAVRLLIDRMLDPDRPSEHRLFAPVLAARGTTDT